MVFHGSTNNQTRCKDVKSTNPPDRVQGGSGQATGATSSDD
jgi:hypothetical protein